VWVTPTGKNNVAIYGLALGLMALPNYGHLQIGGINVELNPFAIFTLPGSMITTMLNPIEGDFYADPAEGIRTEIHGISISAGMFEEVEMNGVSLNINSYVGVSHGLELSMWMNSNYSYFGTQLSLWGNRAVEGNGLQVGCFNSCKDCRGIQIGFLNRMGNRVLPIINFNFRKNNQKSKKHSKPNRKR